MQENFSIKHNFTELIKNDIEPMIELLNHTQILQSDVYKEKR